MGASSGETGARAPRASGGEAQEHEDRRCRKPLSRRFDPLALSAPRAQIIPQQTVRKSAQIPGLGLSFGRCAPSSRTVTSDAGRRRRAVSRGPGARPPRGAKAITLLGDIFHFFIAHPKFETPAIARFLRGGAAARGGRRRRSPTSRATGTSSCAARYVETEFRQVCDEETFEAGGRRFLATHGDLLNEEDLPYRFWRALSKNPISRAAIDFRARRRSANRLVWKVEARLYRSNFKHKTRLPVEMIRAFAARRFREGVDVLLLGHFHQSWSEAVDGGRVEILPAFVDERRWMEIATTTESTLARRRWQTDERLPE